MDTTIKRWTQLYIFAAAALLIVAVAAVTLTAVPTQAQNADTAGTPGTPGTLDPFSRPNNNEEGYKNFGVIPCSEESEPDADTVSVIRGSTADDAPDFYAVFDAFWDYEVEHLSDNFCPPGVTETTTFSGTTFTRKNANIHVTKTAFSVPDSYKVTVVDSNETNGNPSTVTGTKIDLADYPFLREAVSAVKPGPDSTAANPTTVFADTKVWWVRLDEPGTTADETSDLKLALSTALMNKEDWYLADGDDPDTDPDPPVQMRFAAVHVLEAGVPVEVHVVDADFFAFEQRATDTPMREAKWSNVDTAASSVVNMEVGQYKPMQFLFTKPGEYRVQAQIQGHVRQQKDRLSTSHLDWEPISTGTSLTGPTEWYKFHVGPVADVGVTLTHTDETPNDPNTTVTDGTASFSVTATNNGPSTAEGVVVEVNLPVGLDYKANSARIGSATTAPASSVLSVECGVISWRVGDLTATGASSSKTLTFTADVAAGGPKSLTVEAEVHSSTVDENEANDTASAVVETNSTVVTPPFFPGVTRSIPERAVFGAHAGDPVAANNPDNRTLTYTLSGRCNNWFRVDSNGQISLAAGRTLDYDEQSHFDLTISVSDGKNASGGADTSADHWIPVTIRVIDTPHNASNPTVDFSTNLDEPPLQHQTVRITAMVAGLTPDDGDPYSCIWVDDRSGTKLAEIAMQGPAGCHVDVSSGGQPDIKDYTVHINWPTGGISARTRITWFEG